MPLSGNYDALSQQPKYAIPGGAVDKRYVYASNQGWTQRRFKNNSGTEFYDEVLESKTIFTDVTLATRVSRAINGTGVGYPSPNGVYSVQISNVGSGYTSGIKTTSGGSGTGLTVDVTVNNLTGIVATVDTIGAADPARTAGTYSVTGGYTTDGTGTGATFSIVINGSGAASVTVVNGGSGYVVDETFTIPASLIGGTGAPLTFDVATTTSINGRLSTAAVVNYGTGYLNGETVTVVGGTGGTLTIRV